MSEQAYGGFRGDSAARDLADVRVPAAPPPDFESILFPPGLEALRAESAEQPDCFIDLNLDQIVAAVVAKRDEKVLRPIFYSPYRSEEVVRYRQEVFADLERAEAFKVFPAFREAMRSVRANIAYAGSISLRSHKHAVHLRAAWLYCQATSVLARDLISVSPSSTGLRKFLVYLDGYVGSAAFRRLFEETAELRDSLSQLSYGMLFRGDKVTVRKYASEPDYTVTVLERFGRFRETEAAPPPPGQPKDDFSLNHIEEAILEFVSRLFTQPFRRLEEYVGRHPSFVDETIARFDREIDFFLSYLEFIAPFRRVGLPFCRPEVSTTSKETEAVGSFDLALAAKLLRGNVAIVRNGFRLSDRERLLVVSGPNQGGKTTFARMFGQLHFLAGLGCPIPGEAARLFLPDRIYTHFEREEDITNLRGKLEDELVRLHNSCQTMTSNSVVVLNEIFNSTSLDDQVFLSTKILERLLAADILGVCVTFVDVLSTLSDKMVSMVSVVDAKNPARRTFEIVRRAADGLAYALSLAQKHGVTYEQLRRRIRP